jgi:hypothetical protein
VSSLRERDNLVRNLILAERLRFESLAPDDDDGDDERIADDDNDDESGGGR